MTQYVKVLIVCCLLAAGCHLSMTATTLQPFDVYAQLPSTEAFLPIQDVSLGIAENPPLDLWSLATNGTQEISNLKSQTIYDLQGRRVSQPTKGLYIINGRCVIIK